jgi:hypothetical protein
MNLSQIDRLLPGFLNAVKYELDPISRSISCGPSVITRSKNSCFRVCWYGSAGGDKKIVEIVNGFQSVIGYKVSIFFLTDVSFFSYFNCNSGAYRIPLTTCKFLSNQGPKSVCACIFPHGQLGLEIGTADELFEEKVIELGLQVDVACHAGGMAGPGPQNLGSIKARHSLGFTPRSNTEMRYVSNKKFRTEPLKEVVWGLSFDGVSELRRVIRKARQCL